MLFQPNSHSPRRRSSSSKAVFERPGWTAPRPFVYATNAGYARGALRDTLNLDLRGFSGDNRAKMWYTAATFRDRVLLPYGADLVGWPSHIPFRNLSGRDGPSVPETRELLELARSGILRFTHATPEKLRAAQLDVANAVPGPIFSAPLPKIARRDIGSRKPRFDEHGDVLPPRYERNGPKSAAWIGEEVADSESVEPVGLRPITMWKDGMSFVQDRGSRVWMEATEGLEELEDDPISDWDPPKTPCAYCAQHHFYCFHQTA
ncbi:hypothetical protein V8D89_016065 [Ganoderma adspersum]